MGTEDEEAMAKAQTAPLTLYLLLGLTPTATVDEIKRAYRRTALKLHPDKNKDNKDAVARFHALTDAVDVLSNPDSRAVFDQRLKADQARQAAGEAMDVKRKNMVDDLARRERQWKADQQEQSERDRVVRQLADEGKRMVEELRKRQTQARRDVTTAAVDPAQDEVTSQPKDETRSIRVRWPLEGVGLSVSKEYLDSIFPSDRGVIGVVVPKSQPSKPHKARLHADWKHRKPVGRAVIIFSTHAAAAILMRNRPNDGGQTVMKDGQPLFLQLTWTDDAGDAEANITTGMSVDRDGSEEAEAQFEMHTLARLRRISKLRRDAGAGHAMSVG